MSKKLKSIMEAADHLTVDSIAEEPYCATSAQTPAEIFAHAANAGYDWLPVRDEDGMIRRIVQASRLEHLTSWREVQDQGRKVTVDDLVGRDAPIFSILRRIEERPFLLCLGRNGIDRIVTVFDVNQAAAHYFGFALAIIIESEVARAIEAELGERGWADEEAARAAVEFGVPAGTIEAWRRARQASTQLSLIASLSFGNKLQLLQHMGLSRLESNCAAPRDGDRLLDKLREVYNLRNDVAHERSTLENHQLMCRRLRIAHELAHELTVPRE